jgi:hypothetical protein
MDRLATLTGSARARAEQLVDRCGGGREYHGHWKVCCPSHPDRHPSLTISYDSDRVLVHCFTGCDPSDILHRLGVHWSDLFDDGRDHPTPPKRAKHLGPRIPEPPGDPTEEHVQLHMMLELLIDDVALLEIEPCKDLLRRLGHDPLMRLWIDQQLRHHGLDAALVWRVVTLAPASTASSFNVVTINRERGTACP